MRYKVKALVGFYQCIAAVPSVYSVQPPLGLEHLTRWINLLELPSEFERIFLVPTACLGDYSTRIWVGSTWPLVVILACTACLVGAEGMQRGSQRGNQACVASVRIALARPFQYDEDTSRRYLYADLTLSCDSGEYESTQATAFAMLALWPVGIPLLYAGLLWASRDALHTGTPTSLSRATAFLSGRRGHASGGSRSRRAAS
eukprot:50331-Prymnesium_polylepis.1